MKLFRMVKAAAAMAAGRGKDQADAADYEVAFVGRCSSPLYAGDVIRVVNRRTGRSAVVMANGRAGKATVVLPRGF